MDNLTTWKYLQENGYFKNHKCYREFQLAPEDEEVIEEIRDKVIVDIGCGYARETYYFSKYAKKVYAIDVSPYILKGANKIIVEHGNINTVKFALAENYQEIIKEPIDFVYSKHVFQHITPRMAKKYMKFFANRLKDSGKVDLLFRIGEKKGYPKGKEPIVEYNSDEIKELFKNYKITSIDKDNQEKYKLWRIKADVIKSL